MPKSIPVSPEHFRRAGTLAFPQIPLHAYARPFAEERKTRGEKALVEILRHMMIIREFESMLGAFKAKDSYQDITFAYRGPAHLSIGQEAAAVGAALALDPADHIFGSHRSHGEFIAKGLSAIAKLAPGDLSRIMESHDGGSLLRIVEQHLPATS
ncbi:MAG: thiamine pyrophosphate-dependent enzyme, partial [Aestuariivirga sp.]